MTGLMMYVVMSLAVLLIAAGLVTLGVKVPASRRWIVLLVAFALGVVLDLGTKDFAFLHLKAMGDSVPVFSWFAWTHARNPGAAFGLFEGAHTFFTLVTMCAFVGVPYFVHTAKERVILTGIVMGLILAGVAGNFWDRMVFGYVRDFIDVHTPPTGALHDFFKSVTGRTVWPTFNVADMFITGGAAAVILFLGSRFDDEPKPDPDAPDAVSDGKEALSADGAASAG